MYVQNAPNEIRSVYKSKKIEKIIAFGTKLISPSILYQNPINPMWVRFGECTYVGLRNLNSPIEQSSKFNGFDMLLTADKLILPLNR